MQVNKKEIANVSNALPSSVTNRLKKLGKHLLFEVFKDILLLDHTYQPINISKRISIVFLLADLDINLFCLFYIFLFMSNCDFISSYININVEIKRLSVKD